MGFGAYASSRRWGFKGVGFNILGFWLLGTRVVPGAGLLVAEFSRVGVAINIVGVVHPGFL